VPPSAAIRYIRPDDGHSQNIIIITIQRFDGDTQVALFSICPFEADIIHPDRTILGAAFGNSVGNFRPIPVNTALAQGRSHHLGRRLVEHFRGFCIPEDNPIFLGKPD